MATEKPTESTTETPPIDEFANAFIEAVNSDNPDTTKTPPEPAAPAAAPEAASAAPVEGAPAAEEGEVEGEKGEKPPETGETRPEAPPPGPAWYAFDDNERVAIESFRKDWPDIAAATDVMVK